MHRIIKIEEQDYPIGVHYDPAFFNHCMTTFHDQESSQEIIHTQTNTNQVVKYLTQTIDLCDTPLINILNFVQSNEAFQGVDFEKMKRKIMKQKYILKRNRAKNRKATHEYVKTEINYCLANEEKVEEYKKQRNRISAQISRDRKKEKVRELEEQNQLLREEYNRIKLQNEKIQQQLKATQHAQETPFEPFKNKWNKLLLILGLICLFGIVQDFLAPQTARNATVKMENSAEIAILGKEEPLRFSEEEKAKVFANMQLPLAQLLQSKPKVEKVVDKLKKSMESYKAFGGIFSQKARQQIEFAKKMALS